MHKYIQDTHINVYVQYVCMHLCVISKKMHIKIVSVTMVTAEIGDFDEVQCKQHLLNNKYIPEQDTLMDKIFEYHQKHV